MTMNEKQLPGTLPAPAVQRADQDQAESGAERARQQQAAFQRNSGRMREEQRQKERAAGPGRDHGPDSAWHRNG